MAEPARRPIVVVGAGLAGAKTVEALRADGFDGQVVLVGAEPHRPYERPALSKAFLSGTEEREKVFVHPEQWYAEHDVDLRVGTTATAIRPGDHEVVLSTGEALAYDKLTLATGSEPRRLPVPGAELPAVMSLRTLDDSERLKQVLRPGSRAVMIGGGWIGLEVAAAARGLGAEVTVLEGL